MPDPTTSPDTVPPDALPALAQAAACLRTGGVVAFPTETVYGLGANAWSDQAVARIFEIKQRPRFDPLIVHVAGIEGLDRVAGELTAQARRLIDRFWPGPLTLILPKHPAISDLVTAGLPTVGVRMPRHPLALELIRQAGLPIAAPSANPFGQISPTLAAHVVASLGNRVDHVIDGGPCAIGVESTILSLVNAEPLVLRLGGLAIEELEAAIGPVRIAPPTDDLPLAPGRLERHYAPQTPLRLLDSPPTARSHLPPGPLGLLAFREPVDRAPFAAVEVLSAHGDLREAATNLFAAMRRLDALGLQQILAESLPETGLGRAINDRLRRAAHQDLTRMALT